MKTKFTLLVLALPLVTGSAAAATYKWVDSEGNTHYADQPVQGAAQVSVKVAGAADDSDAGAADTDKKSDQQVAAEARAQQCDRAKKRLASFQKADTIIMTDELGRKTEMKGEERVQAIVKAQRNADEFCAPAPEQSAAAPAPVEPAPAPEADATSAAADVGAGTGEAGAGDSGGY